MTDDETPHDVLERHWIDNDEPTGPLSALTEDDFVRRPNGDDWYLVTEVVAMPGWAVAVVRPPGDPDADDVAVLKGGSLRQYPMLDNNLNDPLVKAGD